MRAFATSCSWNVRHIAVLQNFAIAFVGAQGISRYARIRGFDACRPLVQIFKIEEIRGTRAHIVQLERRVLVQLLLYAGAIVLNARRRKVAIG